MKPLIHESIQPVFGRPDAAPTMQEGPDPVAEARGMMDALCASGVPYLDAFRCVTETFGREGAWALWSERIDEAMADPDLMSWIILISGLGLIDAHPGIPDGTADHLLSRTLRSGKMVGHPMGNGPGDFVLAHAGWLRSLPEGLAVAGDMHLEGDVGLTSLPDGLSVGGDLWLAGSGLRSLPKGLRVDGDVNLMKCPRWDRRIPPDARIGGKIHSDWGLPKNDPTPMSDRALTLAEWRSIHPEDEGPARPAKGRP
jgi:hypothetical protein